MSFERETLVRDAIDIGFSHAGLARIETLRPMEEVRNMCAVDKCHAYDKTWTCPPGCGTIEECGARMKQYDWGILLQITAELEDAMDYEGMMDGAERLKTTCDKFLAKLRGDGIFKDILPLTAASCDICKECTYPDKPCRFPDKATSAMEGYGLLVSKVCQENGLKYYYGENTVTYTALFLIRE